MTIGYVHSVEIGSFVDGPGIRFVVFLSGCPLRCAYCHNPDSWKRGEPTESEEILRRIARAAPFLTSGRGGVTVSGGEPLTQPAFALELFRGARALGLHTALDTSGYLGDKLTDEMLAEIDLVLLDIKSYDPEIYRETTCVEVEPTLRLARRLSEMCKPIWVRFVLVPGLTDDPANIAGLARFVGTLRNVERVEVIGFHQMAAHKYEQLGIEYRLADTPPASPEQVEQAKRVFAAEGLPVDEGVRISCGPNAEG